MCILFLKKHARSVFWMKHNRNDARTETEKKAARKAPMKEIVPLIEETVKQDGTFRLITAGTSMKPLLRDRMDTVVLTKAHFPLKRYDIPLYRRAGGQYVLHRVMKCEKDKTYTLCGDNQLMLEKGIKEDAIIAVACEIERGGKTIRFDSIAYSIYVFFWCRCFFIRTFCLKLRSVYGKIKIKKEKEV